ncbi:MAG: hypothetical protein NT076_05680 [Candidatus Pacearchaeota archaeon]|nr:hypothetical protein [Candidatus Pacearchaeota archaeon]
MNKCERGSCGRRGLSNVIATAYNAISRGVRELVKSWESYVSYVSYVSDNENVGLVKYL